MKKRFRCDVYVIDDYIVLELPQNVIVELPQRDGGGEFNAKELLIVPIKGGVHGQVINDIKRAEGVFTASAYSLGKQAVFAVLKKGANTTNAIHKIVHILRKRGR